MPRSPAAVPPVPATPRATYGTSINVYDSQGVAKPVNLYFQKTATANTWDVYDTLDDPTAVPPVVGAPIGQITFDNNGAITGPAATPATGFVLTLTGVNPSPPNPNGLPTLRYRHQPRWRHPVRQQVLGLRPEPGRLRLGRAHGHQCGSQRHGHGPLLQRRDTRRRPDCPGQLP